MASYARGGSEPPAAQRPPRLSTNNTNNDAQALSTALNSLSLNPARGSLPPSPALHASRRLSEHQRFASSPASPRSAASPLRRASSMADHRSPSPATLRRGSSQSTYGGEVAGSPLRPSSRMSTRTVSGASSVARMAARIEERQPLTAAAVAKEFFERELRLHEGELTSDNISTMVVLHDSCYGHRFSRPKTSKTSLSMIVERPERILASALGVSAAYIRLGERHSGGPSAPHPNKEPDRDFPFKIRKTSRMVDITSPVVTNVHGSEWMHELKQLCDAAGEKLATTGKELKRTQANGPAGQPVKEEFHEGDLYLCKESLSAFQGALGGVLDGVDAVFEGTRTGRGPSRVFVCIRPPGHHCSADFPSGFCWLNNVHVGIQHAALTHGLTHAAIIDFDLHHGDGSQSITWDHNVRMSKLPKNTPTWKKTAIGYFSLHDINSYPCEWGDAEKVQNASLCIENAHGQSIWNIHLQPWKTEEEFWDLYEKRYQILLDKARVFLQAHSRRLRNAHNQQQPKAAIFISAGFDASEWEGQGMQRHKVNVPTEFYARFTRDIVRLADEPDLGVDGRVISVLEGGYSDRALCSGVLSHISGLCSGQKPVAKTEPVQQGGLGYEMGQKVGNLNLADGVPDVEMEEVRYNPEWWHERCLSVLESLVNDRSVPLPTPKATTRPMGPHHYSSPTQSFTAKVVDPSKLQQRTVSGSVRASVSPSRAPTPPPPDVDWATAAHELSKLIIPSSRQTKSCRPEELSVKKEKTPAAVQAPPPPDPSGRQLRGRKSQPSSYAEPDSDDDAISVRSVRTVSGTDRRKTIADFAPGSGVTTKDKRPVPPRRLSVASDVSSVGGENGSGRAPSRATTVASSRAPVGATKPASGVQIKKTRTVAAQNAQPPKGRAGTRVPSLPSTDAAKKAAGTQNGSNGHPDQENDMDALTTGLKRITLKLPPKEEYEARQREKAAAEAAEKKKTTKTATKKAAPAARTTKSSTTVKKTTTKDTKAPVTSPPPGASEEPPKPAPFGPSLDTPAEQPVKEVAGPKSPIEKVAATPLAQPQPTVPITNSPMTSTPVAVKISSPPPSAARAPVIPPDGPEQLALEPDQLPQSHTTPVSLPETISPPRPDTPPPPPPAAAPTFVQYKPEMNMQEKPAGVNGSHGEVKLQWLQPNSDPALAGTMMNAGPRAGAARPSSPARKLNELPTFSANGVIPFAPLPKAAAAADSGEQSVQANPPRLAAVPALPPGSSEQSFATAEKRDVAEVPERTEQSAQVGGS